MSEQREASGEVRVIDYNGEGRWSREEILRRYAEYARGLGVSPRDLSTVEHRGHGRAWVYPVMNEVIKGIEAGDRACVMLGIECIEEDAGFPFGRIIKSNAARALRRVGLTEEQEGRVRRRVLSMLRDGRVPHEYKEYAKLLRRIGVGVEELRGIEAELRLGDAQVKRFYEYFVRASEGVG